MTLQDESSDASSGVHGAPSGAPVSGSWTGEERRRDEDAPSNDDSDIMALELDQLITEYFELQREGRAPSPDEFISSHPAHEHALRAVLPGASLLDQLGKRAEDATPFSRSGERLGEFKLLGILGRGGMGVVYEAVQETLDRPVALKVLPASRVIDRRSRERFMREAQAAASLQHPGIVPVYGVGEADGQVYYAMQRIDGVPLDLLTAAVRGDSVSSDSTLILERAAALAAKLRAGRLDGSSSRSLDGSASQSSVDMAPPGEESSDHAVEGLTGRSWMENAVRIALQAAEALSYAHSRGVLHRDVKPSNLMLDDDGRVYVTDFGLCKTADNSSLTAAGDVVGTLRYVPPERFHGRDDARGDVYGVGLILYELLCGRPAFPQRDRAELVQAVTLQSPPRPRKINKDIPEDLERVVLAATAKLPEERYASTEALIADLTAFLAGRPIRARAPGKLYLAKLFARRNRALVATAVGAMVLIAASGLFYVQSLRGLVTELESAQVNVRRARFHADIGEASNAILGNHESLARRHLDLVPEGERDWLWHTIDARANTALLVVDPHETEVLDASLDGGLERIAVLRDSGIKVHRIEDGEELLAIPEAGGALIEFIPGAEGVVVAGKKGGLPKILSFAAAAPDSDAQEEDAEDSVLGQLQVELANHDFRGVVSMDSSAQYLALGASDGRVMIFGPDRMGGARVFQCVSDPGAKVALFGTDGRVAHAARGDEVTVCGPAAGRMRKARIEQRGDILDIDGASNEPLFAVLTPRGKLFRFTDDGRGEPFDSDGVLQLARASVKVALGPDGDKLLATAHSGLVQLWTAGRSPSIKRVRTVGGYPAAVLWPNAGPTFIAAGASGDWRRIPVPDFNQGLPGISRSRGQFHHVSALGIDRLRRYFATADVAGAWSIFGFERRLPVLADVGGLHRTESLALESDGDGPLALALGGEALRVWRREGGGAGTVVIPGLAEVIGLGWIGDVPGQRLVVVLRAGQVHLVEFGGDGEVSTSRLLAELGDMAIKATFRGCSGDVIVGMADARIMRVDATLMGTDVATVSLLAQLPLPVLALDIDDSGEALAVVTDDQELRVLQIADGKAVPRDWSVPIAEPGQKRRGSTCVAIDGAGGWIVTGTADGVCRTWSVLSGRPGPQLLSVFGVISAAEFPEPGKPPIVLEYRGRVSHFELDGVDRSGGAPGCVPDESEVQALRATSGQARLESINSQLKRSDLTLKEARLLEKVSNGIYFFARYNRTSVSPAAARAAHMAATERRAELEALEGP